MAEEVVSMEQATSAGEVPKAGKRVKEGSRESGGLKKGPWTSAEDAILMEHVQQHGEGNWNRVQRLCGLKRCGKSCRLRWANHLRPNLKKGSFSPEEEELILRLHAQLGNKWARMAAHLPGRTDNEIKNFWNTRLKRRQRVGLPIYPPKIQDTVGSESRPPPQHHAGVSSGMPPLPSSTRSWPKFNSLPLPSPFYPSNPCPTSRITLPPIPWNPFPCQLDFGFSLKSISPPSTPTSLLQKHLIATQSYNMAPLVPPRTQVTMELPSFQMYPNGGGGGNISGQSSCMLMEALLQDTHVADDINIGELLLPPDVDEHVAGWEELVYGGDLTGCNDDESRLPATKIEGLDCGTGSTINGEGVSDSGITEYISIPALLEMPASTTPTIPDCCNVGSTGESNIAQYSAIQANDDLGFELQQLASAFSHDPSDQEDWNINALAPWDMPGIC